MRDRQLTGPWAGFAFKGGKLVSPEGREYVPEDLAWLALTVAQAHEWRRMMAGEKKPKIYPKEPATVVDLAEAVRCRANRSAGAMAGPSADTARGVQPIRGPRP